jgi:error-prone DNA polymerase
MATFKNTGTIGKFRDKLIGGMVARGYDPEFAARTFAQLEGFGSYGFPESHAASFALIAYASAWLKCCHPDVFCAALLNSQPMGFYAPAQIVRDAREHGVEIRPICVNRSRWDCTLEPKVGEPTGNHHAVRLGLRMVRGLNNASAAALLAARGDQDFASIDDLWRRAGIPAVNLVTLAEADAFLPAFGIARREALWAIKPLRDEPLRLFAAANSREQAEPPITLHPLSAGSDVVEDYDHVGLTLRRHPLTFLREDLRTKQILPCAALREAKDGSNITVAGLVLMRQRPGTAKGVVFFTLEDETGTANAVVWSQVFERQRRVAIASGLLAVRGYVQREGEVVHLIARSLEDLSQSLTQIGGGEAIALRSRDFR